MAIINPDASFIEENFKMTLSLARSVEGLGSLLGDFADEYAICPASTRREFFSCFPGGLAYHNLQVMKWLSKFSTVMEHKVSKETMVKLAILHQFGKVGVKEKGFYLRKNSDWHDKNGIFYEINSDVQFMKVSHRSIFLANQYKISLSEEEYLAILLQDGLLDDSNAKYAYNQPQLASVFHNALQWSIKIEKDNIVNWPFE